MRRPVRSAPAPLPSVGGTPRRDSLGAGGCLRSLARSGRGRSSRSRIAAACRWGAKSGHEGDPRSGHFRDRVPGWRGPRGLRHDDGGGVPRDLGAPPEGGMAEAGPGTPRGAASRAVGATGLGPEGAERSERPPTPAPPEKRVAEHRPDGVPPAGSDGGNPVRPVSARRERSSPVLISNKAGAGVAEDLRRGRGADHGGPGPVRAAARFRVASLPPTTCSATPPASAMSLLGPEPRHAGRVRRRAPPPPSRSPPRLPAHLLPLPLLPCRPRLRARGVAPGSAEGRPRQESRSRGGDLRGRGAPEASAQPNPRRRRAVRTVLFRGRQEDARGGWGAGRSAGGGRGATLQVIC